MVAVWDLPAWYEANSGLVVVVLHIPEDSQHHEGLYFEQSRYQGKIIVWFE